MLNTDYGRIERHAEDISEIKRIIKLNTDYGRIESIVYDYLTVSLN